MWQTALRTITTAGQTSEATAEAMSTLSTWLRHNAASSPVAASNVAALLCSNTQSSKLLLQAAHVASPPASASLASAIVASAAAPGASSDSVCAIANNLTSTDNPLSGVTSERQKLVLLSAVSRTPWRQHQQMQERTMMSESRSAGAPLSRQSQATAAAQSIFRALSAEARVGGGRSSAGGVAQHHQQQRDAAAALYARCLAPMFLVGGRHRSSSIAMAAHDQEGHDLLSLSYQRFLDAARRVYNIPSDNREEETTAEAAADMNELRKSFENLPEQRPLVSVFARVLIKRRMWQNALSVLLPAESKSQGRSDGSNHGSSSTNNADLQSAVAGIHAAMGNWNAALSIVSQNIHSTGQRLKALSSIAPLLLSAHGAATNAPSSNNTQHHARRIVDEFISAAADQAVGVSPTSEQEAEQLGAAHALAIALSSGWQRALMDFSMVATSVAAYSLRGHEQVVRNTLCFEKQARRRLLHAAAVGGKVDLLKMSLKMLVGDHRHHDGNDCDDLHHATVQQSTQQPSVFFSNPEARSLIRLIGVELRDASMLRELRESWPSSYAAKLALKAESNLYANQVLRSTEGVLAMMKRGSNSDNNNSNGATNRNHINNKHKIMMRTKLVALNFLQCASMLAAQGISFSRTEIAAVDAISGALPAVLQTAQKSLLRSYERQREQALLRRDVEALIAKLPERVSSSTSAALSDTTEQTRRKGKIALSVFEKTLDANFAPAEAVGVYKRLGKALAAGKVSLVGSATSSLLPSSSPSSSSSEVWWDRVAREMMRIDSVAPLLPLQRIFPLWSSSAGGNDGSICTALLRRVLLLTEAPRGESVARRRLARCLIELLARSPSDVRRAMLGQCTAVEKKSINATVGDDETSDLLETLVRREKFPRRVKNNSGNKSDSAVAEGLDDLRVRILMKVAENQLAHKKQTRSSSSHGVVVVDDAQDAGLRPGWIGGAADALDTIARAVEIWCSAATAAEHQEQTQHKEEQVLWILQQSAECQKFVRGEAARIVRARSADGRSFLAMPTVKAELWRHLCRLFEAASMICVNNDGDRNRRQEETQKKNDGENVETSSRNIAAAQFVATCADVFSAGAADNNANKATHTSCGGVDAAAVVFCIQRALLLHHRRSASAGVENDEHQRHFHRQRSEFIVHACHVENSDARMKLIDAIASTSPSTSCRVRATAQVDDVVDDADLSALHRRLEMLARAEGAVEEVKKN